MSENKAKGTQARSPESDYLSIPTQDEVSEALVQINGLTAREIAVMYARALKEKKLYEDLANKDPLTGLLNRRGMIEEFDRIKRTLGRKYGEDNFKEYSIILMDLVGLHAVNETESWEEGNKFLLTTSEALKEVGRRGSDLLVRYGSDEFVMISPNTNEEGALSLASRIQGGMPENRVINMVVGRFKGDLELPDSMDDILSYLNQAKMISPKDQYGRSTGFGVILNIENV